MIGYIQGKVIYAEAGVVILENNGVGYEVVCSGALYAKLLTDGKGAAYTYLQVRDDGVTLFGFVSPEEKKMFQQLTTVSGVGAKMGIAVLSAMNVGEIAVAIASSDVRRLTSVKGLGKKTAERIILELREKVAAEQQPAPAGKAQETAPRARFWQRGGRRRRPHVARLYARGERACGARCRRAGRRLHRGDHYDGAALHVSEGKNERF